jgi:fused signal recognition particle receptor
MGFLKKVFSGFNNTKKNIKSTFEKVFNLDSLSKDDYILIEECLLGADISWSATEKIIKKLKSNFIDGSNWEEILFNSFKDILEVPNCVDFKNVIIMVGVNGVGKTTASAKLAKFFKDAGNKVMLVAADTYRAAAVNQLELWSKAMQVDFISNKKSSDPASVSYDGVESGLAKKIDYIIIDTAGRLQVSDNLMNELEKIYRVISKLTDQITVVMNIDSNIGQNSVSQIENFNKYIPLDSIVLNKMDGTSKGGVIISIIDKLKIPVSFLGVGEKMDDLVEFNIDDYLKSLIDIN